MRLFIIFVVSLLVACGNATKTNDVAKDYKLVVPTPPAVITDQLERVNYMLKNYWENYDFADTTAANRSGDIEQYFSNYLNILSYGDAQSVALSIEQMMGKAVKNSVVFDYFFDLYDRYLYDPNSPMRNEELYIMFLKWVVASPDLSDTDKERSHYRLNLALKNRVGEKAADISFKDRAEVNRTLYGVKAQYVILFFNNPDCHDCARVTDMLTSLKNDGLKVVSIYPDRDIKLWREKSYPKEWINGYSPGLNEKTVYDLKAIPTLYLLDRDKRVLLKDVTIEQLLQYFEANVK